MRPLGRLFLAALTVFSFVLVLAASIPDVPSGTWKPWAAMSAARAGAAAALLGDGRLLIIGGTDANGAAQSSIDVFGTDGNFSVGASMQSPRAGHAATVLQDGRVLVTGGTTIGGGITNSAEVYDPTSDTWSTLHNTMTDSRSGQTATLLNDGRVLLAGGQNSGGAVSTLEVFDPTNNSFRSAGVMSSPRMNHSAALLGDGRVLIVGGSDGTNALATTDIFDPTLGTASAGPSLSIARTSATATVILDGKVVVIGGSNGSQDLASAEIYDPSTGQFALSASSLGTARSGHQAFLLPDNNAILVVGGSSAGDDLNSAELYYQWTDGFQSTAAMSVARPGLAGSALNLEGRMLVAGGTNIASSELYGFATIKTDQSDYAPGQTVNITGSGWQHGESVTITQHEDDGDPDLVATVQADSSGNISDSEFAPNIQDIGVHFHVTAVGGTSKWQAQTVFTDGNATSVSGTVRSSAGGNPAISGATITCTSGCNNNPAATTTSGLNGAYVFNSTTTKLSFNTNGPVTLKLTASATGFNSETITLTNVTNGEIITGNDFSLTPADTTPPVITPTVSGTLGNNGWYTSNVTVSWTVTDPESTITSETGCTTTTINADTTGTTLTCTATSGGGTSSQSVTIKRDATPPSNVSGAPNRPADHNGWYNHSVQIVFSGTDPVSGIASCTSSTYSGPDGSGLTFSGSCTDNAGNTSATVASSVFKYDATAPAVTATASRAADHNDWYNQPFSVHYAGSDATSGIASCDPDGNYSGPDTSSGSISGSCTDNAGNSASASYSFKYDATAPTITFVGQSPAPNGNGWNNSDVTLTWTCADATSGPVSSPVTQVISTEGAGQSATGTCMDQAGNSASHKDGNVSLDKTAPTVSVTPDRAADHNGWYNHAVTYSTTGSSDALSGIDSCDAAITYSGPDSGTASVTLHCTDKAGNQGTGTANFKYDVTAPAGVSGAPNRSPDHGTWYNHQVDIVFSGSDAISGIDSCTTIHYSGPDASSVTVNGSCTDLAGNTSAAVASSAFNYDATPPGIAFVGQSPAANANGWNNSDVTLSWTCTDATSGAVASPVTQLVSTEGIGQSRTGICMDVAGNSASSTNGNVSLDKTPPTLNPSVSPNPVVLNGSATASAGASDSLSGIASQSCGAVSTSGVGSQSVSCTATDKAGNTATATDPYSVIYAKGGMCDGDAGHQILQPVNADGSSTFKQGSTVPAKFRVCDANGMSIGASNVVKMFNLIQIMSGTASLTVDEAVVSTTPDTAFRWDPTGQQWIFNISTKPLATHSTYFYQISLNDGSSIMFQFGLPK